MAPVDPFAVYKALFTTKHRQNLEAADMIVDQALINKKAQDLKYGNPKCATCKGRLHSTDIFTGTNLRPYVKLLATDEVPYAVNCCECNDNLRYIDDLFNLTNKSPHDLNRVQLLKSGKATTIKMADIYIKDYTDWLKKRGLIMSERKQSYERAAQENVNVDNMLGWSPKQINEEVTGVVETRRWQYVLNNTSFVDFAKNYLILVGGKIDELT